VAERGEERGDPRGDAGDDARASRGAAGAGDGPAHGGGDPGREADLARLFGARRDAAPQEVPAWLKAGAQALGHDVARVDAARAVPGALPKGARIGPWVVLRPLGAGGQGVVYLAAHESDGRRAAVKVPRREVAARLLREARILERLEHPRIVRLLGACFDGDAPYIAMEYLAGGSLVDAIARLRAREKGSHLSPERVVAIAAGVLEALQYAHERGIVHRDVKPANILFDAECRVHVGDFGIGALSLATAAAAEGIGGDSSAPLAPSVASGAEGGTRFAGTPAYMAPEQESPALAEGGRVDGRADLFSLGKALYEAMTLRSARTIRPVSLDRPDLPVEWDAFIWRLVEERPRDRFASAAEARKVVVALAMKQGHPMALIDDIVSTVGNVAGGIRYPLEPRPAAGPPAGPPALAPSTAPALLPWPIADPLAWPSDSPLRPPALAVPAPPPPLAVPPGPAPLPSLSAPLPPPGADASMVAYSKGYQDAVADAKRAAAKGVFGARGREAPAPPAAGPPSAESLTALRRTRTEGFRPTSDFIKGLNAPARRAGPGDIEVSPAVGFGVILALLAGCVFVVREANERQGIDMRDLYVAPSFDTLLLLAAAALLVYALWGRLGRRSAAPPRPPAPPAKGATPADPSEPEGSPSGASKRDGGPPGDDVDAALAAMSQAALGDGRPGLRVA
jgi:serine/threonine protein kinase